MPTTLRRCLSDVSMIIVRATNSGERAWREEYLKYVLWKSSHLFFSVVVAVLTLLSSLVWFGLTINCDEKYTFLNSLKRKIFQNFIYISKYLKVVARFTICTEYDAVPFLCLPFFSHLWRKRLIKQLINGLANTS